LIAVLHGVAALVPQNLHAFMMRAAFDLDELTLLESHQPRMQEIKRHGEPGDTARREPFV
jgi:hypothetical protein